MIHTFIFTYFGLKYSQYPFHQLVVIHTWNICLKTNIATVRFRRDVNCVEPACIEAIHGIATRIEEIIVYLRIGVDCSNSRVNLWMRGGKAVIKLYRNREVRARLVSHINIITISCTYRHLLSSSHLIYLHKLTSNSRIHIIHHHIQQAHIQTALIWRNTLVNGCRRLLMIGRGEYSALLRLDHFW